MKKYSFKVRFHILNLDTQAYWFDEIALDYKDANKRLAKTLQKYVKRGLSFDVEDVFVELLIH